MHTEIFRVILLESGHFERHTWEDNVDVKGVQ
jgi:hypothetical protein